MAYIAYDGLGGLVLSRVGCSSMKVLLVECQWSASRCKSRVSAAVISPVFVSGRLTASRGHNRPAIMNSLVHSYRRTSTRTTRATVVTETTCTATASPNGLDSKMTSSSTR